MKKILECESDPLNGMVSLIIDIPDGGDYLWIGRRTKLNGWEFLGSIQNKKQLAKLIAIAKKALRNKR